MMRMPMRLTTTILLKPEKWSYYTWLSVIVILFNAMFHFFSSICVSVEANSSLCSNRTSNDWRGYWTAERRQDVYATSRTACRSSPFVWIKDNTTSGQLPQQSWEQNSTMRCLGQPDCQVNNGMIETCSSIVISKGFCWNDISCYSPQCPLCQLDQV
jgi:hypothetical protein